MENGSRVRAMGAIAITAATCFGAMRLLASCTPDAPAKPHEGAIGTTKAAVGGGFEPGGSHKVEAPQLTTIPASVGYQQGSARKVCQLNGVVDYESFDPATQANRRLPAGRETGNAGAPNFDLGFPVQQGSRLWFLFGDIFSGEAHAVDPIMFSDDLDLGSTPDQCPRLHFTSKENGVEKLSFDPPRGIFQLKRVSDAWAKPDFEPLFANRGPAGGVFDDVAQPPRFIVGFTVADRELPGDPPRDPTFSEIKGVLATASLASVESGELKFTELSKMPALTKEHFLFQVPVIVPTDEGLGLPSPQRTGDKRVLLLFGTGYDLGAQSSPITPPLGFTNGQTIFLAAVRMEDLGVDANRWFFLGTGGQWFSNEQNVGLFDKEELEDVFNPETGQFEKGPCIGFFSASYEPTTNKWMIVYACGLQNTLGRPAGVQRRRGIRLRMANKPIGPWSAATQIYSLAERGEGVSPSEGDPGPGRFIHMANQRVYDAGTDALAPILMPDGQPERATPPDGGFNCAGGFPSFCLPNPPQDVNNPHVGCCTDPNWCCDFAFDQLPTDPDASVNPAGFPSLGSATWGSPYAAYLIPQYTQIVQAGDATHPKVARLYFTMSTGNPYVVDLMQSDISFDDEDGDGVKDSADKCRKVYDPNQENCNLEAERKWNENHPSSPIEELGDACDPVPCPRFETRASGVTLSVGTTCSAPRPQGISVCVGREIRDDIVLTHIGSSPIDRVTGERGNLEVPGVETTARFCQHDIAARFDCTAKEAIQERLRDTPLPERFEPSEPWHRITLARQSCDQQYFSLGGALVPSTTCSAALPTALGRGAMWVETYAAIPPTFSPGYRWDYATDYDFWKAGAIIPLPPDLGCESTGGRIDGTCLTGRLWFNGKTQVGATVNQTGGVTVGLHGDLQGEQIASHYEEAVPDEPAGRGYGTFIEVDLGRIFRFLPDPPPPFVNRFETRVAMPVVVVDGTFYALGESERLFDVGTLLDERIRTSLTDGTSRWASSVEASPYAGSPLTPMAITLTADGTEVTSLIYNEHNTFTTLRPEGGGGSAPALQAVSTTAAPVRPSPRSDFTIAYSKAAGRAFLVGGRDATTGARLDDVWAANALTGKWSRVTVPAGVLGRVESATFSFRDGRLWVLDVDPADATARRHRLLRVEIDTGNVTVITSTDRHDPDKKARYERRGLLLDHDGNVLLWASSARTQRHRLARITPVVAGFDASRTKRLPRSLESDPFADLNGFRLFYAPSPAQSDDDHDPDDEPVKRTSTPEVRVDRRVGFVFAKATLAELGELLR